MAKNLPQILISLFALTLCFFTVTGSHGLLRYREMGREVESLRSRNRELERDVTEMSARISVMEKSRFELERTAREDFGFSRPDETVYVFSAGKAPGKENTQKE